MGVPASSASAPPSASLGISGSSMHRATPPSPACDFGGDSRQPAAAASPTAINNKIGFGNFMFDMGSPRLLLREAHDHTNSYLRETHLIERRRFCQPSFDQVRS